MTIGLHFCYQEAPADPDTQICCLTPRCAMFEFLIFIMSSILRLYQAQYLVKFFAQMVSSTLSVEELRSSSKKIVFPLPLAPHLSNSSSSFQNELFDHCCLNLKFFRPGPGEARCWPNFGFARLTYFTSIKLLSMAFNDVYSGFFSSWFVNVELFTFFFFPYHSMVISGCNRNMLNSNVTIFAFVYLNS